MYFELRKKISHGEAKILSIITSREEEREIIPYPYLLASNEEKGIFNRLLAVDWLFRLSK